MYTRAEIEHMSDDQKNKKVKDILDEQAKEKGDSDYKRYHVKTKED